MGLSSSYDFLVSQVTIPLLIFFPFLFLSLVFFATMSEEPIDGLVYYFWFTSKHMVKTGSKHDPHTNLSSCNERMLYLPEKILTAGQI